MKLIHWLFEYGYTYDSEVFKKVTARQGFVFYKNEVKKNCKYVFQDHRVSGIGIITGTVYIIFYEDPTIFGTVFWNVNKKLC